MYYCHTTMVNQCSILFRTMKKKLRIDRSQVNLLFPSDFDFNKFSLHSSYFAHTTHHTHTYTLYIHTQAIFHLGFLWLLCVHVHVVVVVVIYCEYSQALLIKTIRIPRFNLTVVHWTSVYMLFSLNWIEFVLPLTDPLRANDTVPKNQTVCSLSIYSIWNRCKLFLVFSSLALSHPLPLSHSLSFLSFDRTHSMGFILKWSISVCLFHLMFDYGGM